MLDVVIGMQWSTASFCVTARHLTDVELTLQSMLKPRVTVLPGHIQSVYVQNIAKLYGRVLAKAEQLQQQQGK